MAGALSVASVDPLAGKSTISAGLARRLPGATITEVPAGDPLPANDSRIVLVASPQTEGLDALAAAAGGRLAGVIANRVPAKRLDQARNDLAARGLKVLAVVPEDRLLASPTLRDIITALDAETQYLNGSDTRVIERPVIASISADPGQGYFASVNPSAVIVRSDKPDLQLAALNAGATCLIMTGGYPILSYVLDRAQSDEIPLLRTALGTVETVDAIEALFAATPFTGSKAKVDRIEELLAGLDPGSL